MSSPGIVGDGVVSVDRDCCLKDDIVDSNGLESQGTTSGTLAVGVRRQRGCQVNVLKVVVTKPLVLSTADLEDKVKFSERVREPRGRTVIETPILSS